MFDRNLAAQLPSLERLRQADRVCFFGHFHQGGIIAQYVIDYLNAIRKAGFSIVFTTASVLQPVELNKIAGAVDIFIPRENIGLDFGGWATAYAAAYPLTASLLLLTNDSVYFLRDDLDSYISSLLEVPADFYGTVESIEGSSPHIQSWFVLLRKQAYNSGHMRLLLSEPPADLDRHSLIEKYEIGLTKGLLAQGLRYHSSYRAPRLIGDRGIKGNLTHHLWYTLLVKEDFPFLKIDLLRRNPLNVSGVENWRQACAKVPNRIYRTIEDDLLVRGTMGATNFVSRLKTSRGNDYHLSWPELHGFIRRDYELQRGPLLLRLANAAAYLVTWTISKKLRSFAAKKTQFSAFLHGLRT